MVNLSIYMSEESKESPSYEKLKEYMVKKSQEYENENKALGPTLDPIVSPLLLAHSALILLFETSIYTIRPVIDKNYYVKLVV